MNTRIIALRGRGGCGKSKTIIRLRGLLIKAEFKSNGKLFNPKTKDFVDILERENTIIGITSSGDSEDILERHIERMLDFNPQLIVCACRTSGKTNAFIDRTSGNNALYFEKQVEDKNPELQEQVNANDANTLFNQIISEIR